MIGGRKLPNAKKILSFYDRGIHCNANENLLKNYGIRSGRCPREVSELSSRLEHEPGIREGLKR